MMNLSVPLETFLHQKYLVGKYLELHLASKDVFEIFLIKKKI